jgi:transglutaminase/protease-like cytokinesis protein 3
LSILILLEISLLFPKNIEVVSSNHFRNILDETAKQQKSSQKTVDEAVVRAGRVGGQGSKCAIVK